MHKARDDSGIRLTNVRIPAPVNVRRKGELLKGQNKSTAGQNETGSGRSRDTDSDENEKKRKTTTVFTFYIFKEIFSK